MWWRGCAGLGGFGGFGGGFMMLPMMLFWLVVLGLVVWSVSRHHRLAPDHGCHGGYSSGEAREIARRRYAKGEISKEEFTQLMKDLD